MSKRSKNHHYVPKVLQRQFLAEGEQVWYSERGEDGRYCAPYLKDIEKTFFIRNYYTVSYGSELSDIVERVFYGRIDNYLGQVLPKITNCLNEGIVPTFENEPLNALRRVVIEMAKRTPDFTEKYDEEVTGLEVVSATLAALPDDPDDEGRQEMLAALKDPAKLKAIGRTVRVRATIDPSDKINSVLKKFSVRWSVSSTRHSYILSSRMAYQIGNGGSNGLSNPNSEVWMPVSPKAALVLVRDPNNSIPLKSVDYPDHIRQFNEFAARNSNQIASHSRVLIESITGKKADLGKSPP